MGTAGRQDPPSAAAGAGRIVIFKLTFPNGKIFVGRAPAESILETGGVDPALVLRDLTPRQRADFFLRRETIWESASASAEEAAAVEAAYIRALGADDPAMGYNRPSPARERR